MKGRYKKRSGKNAGSIKGGFYGNEKTGKERFKRRA